MPTMWLRRTRSGLAERLHPRKWGDPRASCTGWVGFKLARAEEDPYAFGALRGDGRLHPDDQPGGW